MVEGCEKRRADVYVLKDDYSYLVNDCAWDPQWFARQALSGFIRDYQGFH